MVCNEGLVRKCLLEEYWYRDGYSRVQDNMLEGGKIISDALWVRM